MSDALLCLAFAASVLHAVMRSLMRHACGASQGHAAGQPASALGDNNAAAGAAPGYDLGQQAPADGVFGAGTAQQQQLSPVAQQGLQTTPPGGTTTNACSHVT